MATTTRGTLEMGRRALDFSRAHPDASNGYAAMVTRLAERLATADRLIARQRNGILQVRAATARKRELRHAMTLGHLFHVARAAQGAGAPELARRLAFTDYNAPLAVFHAEARRIADEAKAERERLVAHGLAELVLDDLEHALDKFQTAAEQSDAGRRLHLVATAELLRVADDVVAVVAVLHELNRHRFAGDPAALAAWASASESAVRGEGEARSAA